MKDCRRENYFYDGKHYYRKSAFYRGASFLIYPTMEEVNRNLLIPGDRWHPFCPLYLHPWELKLIFSKAVIPLKRINYPLSALKSYHKLMGRRIYLPSLIDSFYEADDKINMPVLDMTAFYEKFNFHLGDAVRIKVLDYLHGVYKPEYVSRGELEEENSHFTEWQKLMEESMMKVIDLFKDNLILINQFDWANFIGGYNLIHNSTANIHNFLDNTLHFTIRDNNGIYFLTQD